MSQLAKQLRSASCQAAADRERKIRFPVLDASVRLHWGGIRNGEGNPPAEHGWQRKLEKRKAVSLPSTETPGGQPALGMVEGGEDILKNENRMKHMDAAPRGRAFKVTVSELYPEGDYRI